MGFLKRLFSKGQVRDRIFILGLEGVSLDFAMAAARSGLMPQFGELLGLGSTINLNAAIPTVSPVAWASYATGCQPGRHGVFGYVDRTPNPFGVHIPDSHDLKLPTLWNLLSSADKRVGVMNVPLSYPPSPLNGFMVGCSLSPDLAKATYPVELAPRLMEMGYRIEADAALSSGDAGAFFADLNQVMAGRFSACFSLMKSESWDVFQLHISSSDMLNYFFWSDDLNGAGSFSEEYQSFFRKLDSYIGELHASLPAGCRMAVVSTHGFCQTKAQVFINRWLEENGYLHFGRSGRSLMEMHPDSRAYSLVPGRVYINLKGREERGSVPAGRPYDELREELLHRLGGMTLPETGEPLVKTIHRREDLYRGKQVNLAADLIIEPMDGFELKANLDGPGLLGAPGMAGMHRAGGGFFFLEGAKSLSGDGPASLIDLAPTLLELMEVAPPNSMEGRSLL